MEASPTFESIRRSSRARKAPAKYDTEPAISDSKVPDQPVIKQSRPKRKAAQAATQNIVPESNGPTLEEVLGGMSETERREFRGWVELESDPVS